MSVDVKDFEADSSAAPAAAGSSSPTASRSQNRRVDYNEPAKRLMQRCVTDARNNTARLDRDRQDWQNLLFERGGQNHWSVYDRATNSYVPRGTDPDQGGLPDWVPRPVTNLFGMCIDGICSLLDQSEPSKLWSPSTDDDADRATAEVAEDADPVLLEEIGYDRDRPRLNRFATLTNGAAYVLSYNNDPKYGVEEIPVLRCPVCGLETMPDELDAAGNTCPGENGDDGCGTSSDDFEPVIQADGKPFGVPYARGKMCGYVAPSFEYSIPSTSRVTDTTMLPWVLTHSGMPKEDVISRWPKARDVINRFGSKRNGGINKAYARAMRGLSSPSRANAPVAAAGGGGNAAQDEPVVYILHHDPIDDGDFYFPDGLLAVMVEDELLESGKLPFTDDEGRAIKTVLIRTYKHSPGTAFGHPPADDLVPLQISYNLVDSLIQLILMHNAAPRNWIPLSVTLETEPTGRPGENNYYRSSVPGEKPSTEQGVAPPQALFQYLDIIRDRMQEVSKLNSVLAGARPEGDPTLGEVQILQERGMAAFKEAFDQLVWFEKNLSRMLMWIGKRSAWSDRFRRIHGDNGDWDIRKFNSSDLNGKVDVEIEKGTAWPKSRLMRLLQLEKALKEGILPNPQTDPELQTRLLLEYDLISLKPSLDVDRKQIARELDRWRSAESPDQITPPDLVTQEAPLHLFFKKQFLKTEEFEQLREANRPVADAMVAHVQQLQQAVAAVQAKNAANAKPPSINFSLKGDLSDPEAREAFEKTAGVQPSAAPTPPQPADTRTAVQKGDHSSLNAAMASGALRPAGAQPKPDALGDAVKAGVLSPAGAQPQAPRGPSIDELMMRGVMTPAPREPESGAPPM